MVKILEKVQFSKDVFQMKLDSPAIAQSRKAGQFVILMNDEEFAERIPLTIADADAKAGTVTIIFQTVGASTRALAQKEAGQYIAHLLGPLGQPTHIEKYDAPVVCVGGGIGAAPLYPIVQAHKKAGNKVVVILGARNSDLLILEDQMAALADELIVCTDDGSRGRKALVTEPLKEQCEKAQKPAEAVIIGPPIMMKFCAATTRPFEVHTVASLNTIMVDGTGMCGGCRVEVGGENKFVCVDGPEFDAHKVDFDSMMRRLGSYKEQEAHACNLTQAAQTLVQQEAKSKEAAR